MQEFSISTTARTNLNCSEYMLCMCYSEAKQRFKQNMTVNCSKYIMYYSEPKLRYIQNMTVIKYIMCYSEQKLRYGKHES